MRDVVVYQLLSLDGVAEAPDAFITDFDEAMEENLADVIGSQDAVLLGHRTYDEWAEFWPASDIEPFATFINKTAKFVASSKPLDPAWQNTTAIEGDLRSFVIELKSQPGSDIGVHGSIELTQSLLEAGLIDELRLVIAPSIQMQGRKLFERGVPKRLSLRRSVTSPTGYVLVNFRVEP